MQEKKTDMTFNVVAYSQVPNEDEYFNKVLSWCDQVSKEQDQPAAKNMEIDNWQEREETLAWILHNKRRFWKRGEYFLLEDSNNHQIIASSGIYRSDFCREIAIGSVRTFVNPEYRGKFLLGDYLWPAQLEWAKFNNFKAILISFNDYNRRLINIMKRNGLGVKKNRNENKLFHNGIHELPFQINIKNTPQWIIYHKIDENFHFDWESVRA